MDCCCCCCGQISVGGRPAIVAPADTKHFKVFVQGPKGLVPASHPAPGTCLTAAESQVVPSSTATESTDAVDLSLYPNVMKSEEAPSGGAAAPVVARYNCH